jgi:hypothetical protein
MRVKLYGGPAHKQVKTINEWQTRIFFRQPQRFNHRDAHFPLLPLQDYSECSYYLHLHAEQSYTNAGAIVSRELFIGTWEDGVLHLHEEAEVRRDLSRQPWQWRNKPSFLHNFDQWWERESYLLGHNNLFLW